jgi:antitoxin CptB
VIEHARLKWQCRRGTKELDLLLENFLNTRYQQATEQEKAEFAEMLSLEDDVLMEIMLKTSYQQ